MFRSLRDARPYFGRRTPRAWGRFAYLFCTLVLVTIAVVAQALPLPSPLRAPVAQAAPVAASRHSVAAQSVDVKTAPLLLVHGFTDSCASAFDDTDPHDNSQYSTFTWDYLHNMEGWTDVREIGYYSTSYRSGESACYANVQDDANGQQHCSTLSGGAGTDGTPNDPIQHLGCLLAWYIYDNYTSTTPVIRISILAHSMGGLVVRDALGQSGQMYNPNYNGTETTNPNYDSRFPATPLDVATVVTVASPHGGVIGAYAEGANDIFGSSRQLTDMTAGSPFMNLLGNIQAPRGAPQGTPGTLWALMAASDLCFTSHNSAINCFAESSTDGGSNDPYPEGDGVVQASSALAMEADVKVLYGHVIKWNNGVEVAGPYYAEAPILGGQVFPTYGHEGNSCGTAFGVTQCLQPPFYLNDKRTGLTGAWVCHQNCADTHPTDLVDTNPAASPDAVYYSLAEINALLQVAYDVPNGGTFETKWQQAGGSSGSLGDPTQYWYWNSGGQVQGFQHGGIFWSAATGTWEVHGPVYAEYWNTMHGVAGALGFPTTDGIAISNSYGTGTEQFFRGTSCGSASGSVIYYSSGTGAHEVHGCIYQEYVHVGGSVLGFPTHDEQSIGSGSSSGRVSYFNGTTCSGTAGGSAIYYSGATGAHVVEDCIYQTYVAYGGPTSALGYPVSDEYGISGGRESDFQGGYITYYSSTGAVVHLYAASNPPSPSGTSVCATASGPNLTAYCDVPTVTITCGGAIGSRNDYNGIPINWTYTNGTTTCDTVKYTFGYNNGRTDCSYYFYVPNGFATTTIQATLSDGTHETLDENPVSGWQYWFDATGITSLTFTDANHTTGQDLGWGRAASHSIERLCAL